MPFRRHFLTCHTNPSSSSTCSCSPCRLTSPSQDKTSFAVTRFLSPSSLCSKVEKRQHGCYECFYSCSILLRRRNSVFHVVNRPPDRLSSLYRICSTEGLVSGRWRVENEEEERIYSESRYEHISTPSSSPPGRRGSSHRRKAKFPSRACLESTHLLRLVSFPFSLLRLWERKEGEGEEKGRTRL